MKAVENTDFASSISGLIKLSLSLQGLNKSLESKYGLSIVQWSLLNALVGMPAVSPRILAKTLRVTPGTLSQSLNRLAKKDFLFMRSDPNDARKKMISITRSGKNALVSAELEYQDVFAGISSVRNGIDIVNSFLQSCLPCLQTPKEGNLG